MAPLLPSISRTGLSKRTLQVRPLSQRGTIRPWHRPLLHSEVEPRLWPGFATPLRWKRLRQAHGRLLLSLCQRPVYMAIHTSLIRRNHILETVKKGNCEAQTSQHCLEAELNTCAKIQAEFPTHLDTALSRML